MDILLNIPTSFLINIGVLLFFTTVIYAIVGSITLICVESGHMIIGTLLAIIMFISGLLMKVSGMVFTITLGLKIIGIFI